MLEAKAAMIEGAWEKAWEALGHLGMDEMKNTLLTPVRFRAGQHLVQPSDLETLASLTIGESAEDTGDAATISGSVGPGSTNGSVLERLLALQCQYIRGLCLETQGSAYAALSEYVVITACYREAPFERLWRTSAFEPFVSLAMYRYGVLCVQLAGPRSQELPPAICPCTLKSQLLHDAGVALRMFLVFGADGTAKTGPLRRLAALRRYAQALEARFPRQAFRAAFPPEQYEHSAAEGRRPFVPESAQEDILLATMLAEAGHAALEVETPLERHAVQTGAMSTWQRTCTRRLARLGSAQLVVEQIESLFEHFAATAALYGNLVMALSAAGDLERACLAGEAYCQLGGKDTMVLICYAKASLRFGRTKLVASLLEKKAAKCSDEEDDEDVLVPLSNTLAVCYLMQAQKMLPECEAEALQLRERAVSLLHSTLAKDDSSPPLHLTLSLALLELGHLPDAERAVKASLARDASSAQGWFLLALLRTVSQDYDGALAICDMQLDQATHPDLDICLLKTELLTKFFGRGDEIIELLKAMFAYWVSPVGSSSEDGLAWLQSTTGGESTTDEDTGSTLTFNQFCERYVGKPQTDISGMVEDLSEKAPGCTSLRFAELAKRFPNSPDKVKADLFGLPAAHTRQLPNTFLRLEAHEARSRDTLHGGGKRYGLAKLLWLTLADVLLHERRIHEAGLAVQAAFAIDELDSDVYYALGRICEAQGQAPDAMSNFERGLQLNPSHAPCHLGLARRLTHLSRTDLAHLGAAFGHAHAALRSRPDDSQAMGMLAEIARLQGQGALAATWYRKALEAEDFAWMLPLSVLNFVR